MLSFGVALVYSFKYHVIYHFFIGNFIWIIHCNSILSNNYYYPANGAKYRIEEKKRSELHFFSSAFLVLLYPTIDIEPD